MSSYFESSLHALKGLPHVIDIRNYGLMGAIEFTMIPGTPSPGPLMYTIALTYYTLFSIYSLRHVSSLIYTLEYKFSLPIKPPSQLTLSTHPIIYQPTFPTHPINPPSQLTLSGLPTKRATDIFDRCFEKGVFLRAAGGSVVMSPPLICEKEHIDRMINTLAEAIVESSKLLK